MGRKKKTESNDNQNIVEKRVTRLSRSRKGADVTDKVSKPQIKRKRAVNNKNVYKIHYFMKTPK